MKLLIKDLNIKSLVSGDKSARITLETIDQRDIKDLAALADEMEIEVTFTVNRMLLMGVSFDKEDKKK